MGSTSNKSLLDVATQKIVESQVWRSVFRHGYPDTPLNQSLVMMGNVFLHLHPVKVSRQAMKYGSLCDAAYDPRLLPRRI